jgi:hypothetical protein
MTEYIWVNRWDEFQTFQTKRNKPWAPPWIRNYTAQLSDDRYLDLTDRQRALLHDLRMVFAVTRGRLRRDTPTIARYRHRQTRDEDLAALNHAGFIEFCSGTVLEQRRNAFWNRSTLEVDKKENRKEQTQPTQPVVKGAGETGWVGPQTEEEPEPFPTVELKEIPW